MPSAPSLTPSLLKALKHLVRAKEMRSRDMAVKLKTSRSDSSAKLALLVEMGYATRTLMRGRPIFAPTARGNREIGETS